MDTKQFLAEFGHIVNAPGGVQRLRTLVIQLAVKGKLVDNNPLDHSASDLIKEISKIKKVLISKKLMPREKAYPEVKSEELRLQRPSNWLWPRFGEVWQLISGRDLAKSEYNERKIGIPYITGASNIESGIIDINRWTDKPVVVSKESDLLITCKGTIGKIAFNTIGDIHIARQIMAIRDFSNLLNSNFLKIWLESYVSQLVEKSKSMIPGFSRDDLIYAIFPLLPLEEQKRIVAKVDELMALCDKLEAQQQKRRKLQTLTRTTALDALANAQSARELKAAWLRVQDHLPLLLDGPEEIREVKQAIIDLAMSGYLIESHERSVSSGNDLLKAIQEARLKWESVSSDQELKEAQTMRKKLKKQKVASPDRYIPDNWAWGTFLQISQAVVDCHNKTAPYVFEGIHLVRTTDIRKGAMDLRNTKKITQQTYDYWARRMPPKPGDVFFTREAPMGEAAIVPKGELVCLGQRTMLIRLFQDLFNNQFLIYAIYSPSFIARMSDAGIGATVKHLRVGVAEDLVVPVPPIEEQRIIVKKLKRLLEICDQLEKQLTKAQRTAERLAQAAVAAITGTQLKDKETMKAPQTELVTKLKLKASPGKKDPAPLAAILAKHNGELPAKGLWNYSGLTIDGFYQQLKTEMARGWIAEPEKARMVEKAVPTDSAEVA